MSEATRAWIYRVLIAAAPLLVVYGVVDNETAPLWVALGAATLGNGLAAVNTSTK